jgi:hypothetical protein
MAAPMPAALRQLWLAIAVLAGVLALAPRAADDGRHACCARSSAPVVATVVQVAHATAAAEHGCACGRACHCAERAPHRGCECAQEAPQPVPQPAEPSLPKPPPTSGAVSAVRRAPPLPPDLATAAKLCAATASGLPHVLLPSRSRQIALSVWRC